MTGQDAILNMRRNGKSPGYVWVDDCAATCLNDGTHVTLAARDVPEQQDWRFLVGLQVMVSGEDPGRVERITAACAEYAKRVIASTHLINREKMDWLGRPSSTVVRITDTQGVLTWPR
ncbi:MAG: hypothetical protein IV104_13165 [Acidovorax sp.]|nr:hypothetical protein [Acidovorax sp.]